MPMKYPVSIILQSESQLEISTKLSIYIVLSFTQREYLFGDSDLLENQEDRDGDVMMDMGNDSDWEDEVQDGLRHLPPGEEGFLQSHAGGEAVLQAVMDGITLS
jgi:hypothetical protein